MSKGLLIGAALFALVLAGCVTSVGGKAVLDVQASIDLGQLHMGETKTQTITVKNTGTDPLIISDVSTSCGCTSAHISENSIAPGGSADLTITYNSTFPNQVPGLLSRTVTITSNASNPTVDINVAAELLP